ncbi:hypothetical protein BKA81DRAFT_361526 [Phyllosticta paracitricarpa]
MWRETSVVGFRDGKLVTSSYLLCLMDTDQWKAALSSRPLPRRRTRSNAEFVVCPVVLWLVGCIRVLVLPGAVVWVLRGFLWVVLALSFARLRPISFSFSSLLQKFMFFQFALPVSFVEIPTSLQWIVVAFSWLQDGVELDFYMAFPGYVRVERWRSC